MAERPGVVIWGDGGGSTFKATIDAIHDGIVDMDVVGVISTVEHAGILDHAKKARDDWGMDIEPLVVPGRPGRRQDEATQEKIIDFIIARGGGNLALMGAMVIVGDVIVDELNGAVPEQKLPKTLEHAKLLMAPSSDNSGFWLPESYKAGKDSSQFGLTNTHPAPTTVTANTHGLGAQRRMALLRAKMSGITYHAVGKGIDTGYIIATHTFPVEPPHEHATDAEITEIAEVWFQRAQRIEKATLPMEVEAQARRHNAFLGL